MTELSPEARRLLGLARRGDDPLDTDRVRVNHRMAQRLALAAGIASAALGTSKAATGAAAISTLLGKGILTGVLVTASAFGTWKAAEHVVSHRMSNQTTSVPSHHGPPQRAPDSGVQRAGRAPSRSEEQARLSEPTGAQTDRLPPTAPVEGATRPPPSTAIVEQTAPSPTREAESRVQSALPEAPTGAARSGSRSSLRAAHPNAELDHAISAESAAHPDTEVDEPLSAESAALRAVQHAINAGDTTRALRLLDEQDAAYRAGGLVPERAAARIVALCKESRETEARLLAQRFQQRFANSPLSARVSNACGASLRTATSTDTGATAR